MAIVTTLDNGEFYDWLKRSDNYKNNFSYEGANAIAMTFGGSAFLGTTSNGYCWTTQNPNATSLPPVAPQADVQN